MTRKFLIESLRPFEELVSFPVAGIFHFSIFGQRKVGTRKIHLDGMVDDQVHRDQWIDAGMDPFPLAQQQIGARPDRPPGELRSGLAAGSCPA